MGKIRKLRNSVIRSNFGVDGLRHFRALQKTRERLLSQRLALLNRISVIGQRDVTNVFERVARWWALRKIGFAVNRVEKAFIATATKQALLVSPELARKVVAK